MTCRPPVFRFLLLAFCFGLVLTLSSCTSGGLKKAFSGPHLEVSYDDLGTPAMLQPTLGDRGEDPRIVISTGATKRDAQPRRLSAYKGILMLQHNEKELPHTPENEPLRQRMRNAYSRIYQFYRTRRDATMAAPPQFGRGALGRMQLMPPVPPNL